MKKAFEFSKIFEILLISAFGVVLILLPVPCKNGAVSGLLLCGRIIIPSLFPFTMCVLFISKSGFLDTLSFLSPVTKKLFGLEFFEFSVMLMSMIGGYPLGAKLINDAVADNKLTPESGRKMLNYCVNAGPAFVVSAVGCGILGSQKIGSVLLLSHIAGSIIICEISRFFKIKACKPPKYYHRRLNPADNFVLSAAEAANSVFKICTFVILFSVIGEYVQLLQNKIKAFKLLGLLLEVTTAVTKTNNIYVIAFLLGFGGICVWCQILAMTDKFKLNFPLFIIARLSHGLLSSLSVWVAVKLFKIEIATFSANQSFTPDMLYSSPALTVSIIITAIVFVISITTKKFRGKILEDIV